MSDTDKQTLIDLYVKNLKEVLKSFRCQNKVDTYIQNFEIDFDGVL